MLQTPDRSILGGGIQSGARARAAWATAFCLASDDGAPRWVYDGSQHRTPASYPIAGYRFYSEQVRVGTHGIYLTWEQVSAGGFQSDRGVLRLNFDGSLGAFRSLGGGRIYSLHVDGDQVYVSHSAGGVYPILHLDSMTLATLWSYTMPPLGNGPKIVGSRAGGIMVKHVFTIFESSATILLDGDGFLVWSIAPSYPGPDWCDADHEYWLSRQYALAGYEWYINRMVRTHVSGGTFVEDWVVTPPGGQAASHVSANGFYGVDPPSTNLNIRRFSITDGAALSSIDLSTLGLPYTTGSFFYGSAVLAVTRVSSASPRTAYITKMLPDLTLCWSRLYQNEPLVLCASDDLIAAGGYFWG